MIFNLYLLIILMAWHSPAYAYMQEVQGIGQLNKILEPYQDKKALLIFDIDSTLVAHSFLTKEHFSKTIKYIEANEPILLPYFWLWLYENERLKPETMTFVEGYKTKQVLKEIYAHTNWHTIIASKRDSTLKDITMSQFEELEITLRPPQEFKHRYYFRQFGFLVGNSDKSPPIFDLVNHGDYDVVVFIDDQKHNVENFAEYAVQHNFHKPVYALHYKPIFTCLHEALHHDDLTETLEEIRRFRDEILPVIAQSRNKNAMLFMIENSKDLYKLLTQFPPGLILQNLNNIEGVKGHLLRIKQRLPTVLYLHHDLQHLKEASQRLPTLFPKINFLMVHVHTQKQKPTRRLHELRRLP